MRSSGLLAEFGVSRWSAVLRHRPPRALGRRAIGALLVVLLTSSGCYHYVPVAPDAVAPDQEVRVRITKQAAARLAGDAGAYLTELDGTVSPRGTDSLAVAVPIVHAYHGIALDSSRQVLFLAKSDVIDVRRSELARGRTILTSVGALVGFALLARAIVQLTDPNPGTDQSPTPPPPQPLRVPAGHHVNIRIPFP
jgi:hypothetical protein